jgi:hypothetical protein
MFKTRGKVVAFFSADTLLVFFFCVQAHVVVNYLLDLCVHYSKGHTWVLGRSCCFSEVLAVDVVSDHGPSVAVPLEKEAVTVPAEE